MKKFYVLDWYDGVLAVCGTFAKAQNRFSMAVKDFGVSPEALEIVTAEEMKKRKAESYDEYYRRTEKKVAACRG